MKKFYFGIILVLAGIAHGIKVMVDVSMNNFENNVEYKGQSISQLVITSVIVIILGIVLTLFGFIYKERRKRIVSLAFRSVKEKNQIDVFEMSSVLSLPPEIVAKIVLECSTKELSPYLNLIKFK